MRIFSRGRSATAPGTLQASHQTVNLAPGRHRGRDEAMCVMELASRLAGERFTDHPQSVWPTVSALLRAYNDVLAGDTQQDLYRYASEAVGTRGGYQLAERRARFVLAWARSRQYCKRQWRKLLSRYKPPQRDAAPTDVADYVVRSLDRRNAAAEHVAMLGLIDWIIAIDPGGRGRSGEPRLPLEHGVQATLEGAGEQVAHRPRLEALHQR
jgi:hypothetical protein